MSPQTHASKVGAFSEHPQHSRCVAAGESLDSCLRQLEEKVGLPSGDLSATGESIPTHTFPYAVPFLKHSITSNTSEKWARNPRKAGYIIGYVAELKEATKLSEAEFTCLFGLSDTLADEARFLGFLYVSKNCSGIHRDNVCTVCGDVYSQ